MGKGKGFGKTILFGDHFVVYGLKGIPCALSKTIDCEIERIEINSNEKYILVDNRNATQGYKEKKKIEYNNLISRILEYMQVEDKIKITLSGDLRCASGVGASAATATSLARAINDEYSLDWADDQINKAAFEGETAGSGTPSGIDNTAATFGGLIIFQKSLVGKQNKMDLMKIKEPIEIVLGDTGKTSLTKEVVGDVKKIKESNPSEINPLFEEYKKLVEEAILALKNNDLKKVGVLMNKNQSLLEGIKVSSPELEKIIKIALDSGAFGAKLTGTGRGGLMIALTPGKDLQEKVATAIESAGFKTIKAKVC